MAGFYEILEAQWALANADLVLVSDDSTKTVEITNGKAYHIYQTQWNWSTTCGGLDSLWNSKAGNNRTLTNNAELDAMLADVCSEMDMDKRAEKIGAIGDWLTEYAAMIPLYIDTLLTGVGSNVEGLTLNFNQSHVFKYAYVTE
jgi:ABC-type transport system substrate-binding protein